METVSISGSLRANVGTKDAKELRRQGLVPCVVYGGKEQIHFAAPEPMFKPLVYSPNAHIVKLEIGERKIEAIMQEAQFHKISDKLLHVDFLEIVADKPVVMSLPIKVEGSSAGVKAGGKLVRKLRFVKAKGLANILPDYIVIDITNLEIGQSFRVSDLDMKGIEFLDSPNATLVTIKTTRNVVADASPADAKGAKGAAPAKAAPAKAAAPKK